MDDSRHCKPIGTLLPPAARPLQIDIYMMRPMPASTRPESGNDRVLSLIDRLVEPADQALRTLFRVHQSGRPYPADGIEETVDQSADRRKGGLAIGARSAKHKGSRSADKVSLRYGLPAKFSSGLQWPRSRLSRLARRARAL